MNTNYKKILLGLLLVIFGTPMLVWGQAPVINTAADSQIGDTQLAAYDQVSILISPLTPKAGDLVTAELSTSGQDLNQAKITWSINGVQLASDYGLKKVSFNLGKGNVSIAVNVLGADGKIVTGKTEIKTNDVVVLWEATSHTPPFYRGKALAPAGTVFRVIAIPNIKSSNGTKIADSKLVYKWKKNDKVAQDYSGYGKNVYYTVDETYVKDGNNIDAEIYTTDNSADYQTSIYVPHQLPSLFLYKVDPLLGRLYNNAIGASLNYSGTFIKLIAEPYFFSNASGDNEIDFAWTVRGEKIAFTNPIIELKSADGQEISLDLTATHSTKVLQSTNVQTKVIPEQVTSLQTNTF
jgi:hypothetical protein